MPENKKQTMGRRKIEIKKIGREESRQVCFSKRRAGLFKKANELSILCGAELAVLVVSPGGKPYSFSHPSLELISNRFLNSSDDHHHGRQPSSCTAMITSANQSMPDLRSTQNLNNTYILSRMHESCLELMEKERHRKAELDDVLRGTWFSEENLGKFDLGQLDFIQTNLASIREDVHKLLINAKSVYEQQHHHHPQIVENMMELSNVVAGNYDPGQNSFMVAPLNVMNSHDVPNCFPSAYYDYKGACQF